MAGYVKIYRHLLDNPVVCKDSDHLAVWMYLLLNATHKEMDVMFQGERVTLHPGQLITGRKSISSKMGVEESKVKRILISFENDQQIDRQRSNKNSLITVKNWDKYQLSDQQDGQTVTSKCPASDQQVTTNKNVKNDKNVKNERKNIDPLEQAIENFKDHRKKLRKPMTDHAVDLLRSKLDKLATTDEKKIDLIDYAIGKGWLGVYPKDDKDRASPKKSPDGVTAYARPTENYDHLAINFFADDGTGGGKDETINNTSGISD